jgi:hypothetical protein
VPTGVQLDLRRSPARRQRGPAPACRGRAGDLSAGLLRPARRPGGAVTLAISRTKPVVAAR